jgi:hypothetical protein
MAGCEARLNLLVISGFEAEFPFDSNVAQKRGLAAGVMCEV